METFSRWTCYVVLLGTIFFYSVKSSYAETEKIDHYGDNGKTTVVHASAGDVVDVEIINTCSEQFDYEVVGVPLREASKPGYNLSDYAAQMGACIQTLNPKLRIIYSPEFGIYRVKAKIKPGLTPSKILISKDKGQPFTNRILEEEWEKIKDTCKDAAGNITDQCAHDKREAIIKENVSVSAVPLQELMFDIQFIEQKWRYDFAGGFTVSGLHDEKFAIDSAGKVAQAKNEESKVSLGLAAMIHTYHDGLCGNGVCWVPLSFGLGINDDSKVNYFAGTSARLGPKAFLTVGANFGTVKTLPNGLKVGDTADANTLNNQKDKVDVALFVSFSYTFLGNSDATFNSKLAEKK